VPDHLRIEHAMIALMIYALLWHWWRLNRRRVRGWWKRVKDHLPVRRHPKSPKDCPYCCGGLHLETVRINDEVPP
jgi:hypothetical protein